MTRRGRTTWWIIGGAAVLGLGLVVAAPLVGAATGGSQPLFAQTFDKDELQALGSFAPPDAEAPAAAGAGSAGAIGAIASEAPAEAPAADAAPTAGAASIELAAGVAGLAASPEPAAETDPAESIVGTKVSGFSTGDVLGLLWRLALVAGVIWLSILALRRFVTRSQRTSNAAGTLKVLETIGLASNRTVHLLEAGDRVLVVGSTPNHMALLAELTDAEVVTALRRGADRGTTRIATLGDMMRNAGQTVIQRAMAARRPDASAAPPPAAAASLTPLLQQLLATQAALAADADRLQARPAPLRRAAAQEAE